MICRATNLLSRRQGAGAGSLYVAGAFLVAGALTYVFQSISARSLGTEDYGPLALLWSATFLTVQVLWIGGTQTLGRYVAEREARGEGWGPVVSSVRRWQIGLLMAFVILAVVTSPLLTRYIFEDAWLTAAFVVVVAAYAPEYFRRGMFNGHRQPLRLGAQIVAEASSRALVAAVLLAVGLGVLGPALAIVLAPVVGVLAVPAARVPPPEKKGEPFSAGRAFRFAGPVLLCMACAQALMNGGPILASLLGGSNAQVGVLGAALILSRIPQYVLSPAIGALLPHASRVLSTEGRAAFERFVIKAVGTMAVVGGLTVAAAWLLGEWGLKVFAGQGFEASRNVLAALAALAAFYLLAETINQALLALGRARLAALGWLLGLPVAAVGLAVFQTEVVGRVSYSLALGALAAAVFQAAFYLASRNRASGASAG